MAFSSKPILLFWETTRACMLSCKHCRASAIREPLPEELTTAEGLKLIEQVASFGTPAPVIILTGGDPLMRNDLFKMMEHAKKNGVKFAASPAVTDKLTRESMVKMRDAGVTSISVSLDGAFRETHDGIRTVDGTFDKTLDAIREAVSIGLSIQVNTTVMRKNIGEIAKIFHLIKSLGVKTWEVFFLIKVGRGAEMEDMTPAEYESVCNFLYDASKYGMVVRTVEAPFMRRVAKMRSEKNDYWNDPLYLSMKSELMALDGGATSASTIAPKGTLDGDGILFVGYNGDIYPGGFLPQKLGNVREDNIVDVYINSQVLHAIREREISGKCGSCEFKQVCGGSRARAYYSSGDATSADPACFYPFIKN